MNVLGDGPSFHTESPMSKSPTWGLGQRTWRNRTQATYGGLLLPVWEAVARQLLEASKGLTAQVSPAALSQVAAFGPSGCHPCGCA